MEDGFGPVEGHVRARNNLPDDWHAWELRVVGEGVDAVVLVTGARCPHRLKSGPRKGGINFRRRESPPKSYPVPIRTYRALYAEVRASDGGGRVR